MTTAAMMSLNASLSLHYSQYVQYRLRHSDSTQLAFKFRIAANASARACSMSLRLSDSEFFEANAGALRLRVCIVQ